MKPFLVFLSAVLLAACSAPTASAPAATAVPNTPTPISRSLYQSNGGGDPRGAGYWLVWNTCTKDNQSATAKANGGRQAGWLLLDDLLDDPGIAMGLDVVENCQQAAAILEGKAPENIPENNLPFYRLAAALLAAQLNLAIPAESCPAVEQAIQAGQLLLVSVDYHPGDTSALSIEKADKDRQVAGFLIGQLEKYNLGDLCQ